MSVPRFRSACASTQGRRPSNQDQVTVRQLSGDREVLAVADGMGGAAAGEIASALAIEVLSCELEAGAELTAAFLSANTAVHAEAQRNPDWVGMGTTLVALLRTGASYQIANVGDSRAYYLDASSVRQITCDHSFVAEAVRTGSLSWEEAARSPWRNVVTRTLGIHMPVEIDLFGPYEVGIHPHAILLCSDGLYGVLADAVIHQRLLWAENAQAAVGTLSSLAFLSGSTDNITVAVMEFGSLFRSCDVPTMPLDERTWGAGRHLRHASDLPSFRAAGGTHV